MHARQVIGIVSLLLLVTGTARGQFTTVHNIDNLQVLPSIPAGTQVNVQPGGVLIGPSTTTFITGGELNVVGGRVDTNVIGQGASTFNMWAGEMLRTFVLEGTSRGQILGGAAASLTTRAAAQLEMSGGMSGPVFIQGESQFSLAGDATVGWVSLSDGSHMTMLGGATSDLRVFGNSVATVSGGHIGGVVRVRDEGLLTLQGGDFRINGVPLVGPPEPDGSILWDIEPGTIVTGRLADGTAFGYRLEGSSTQQQGAIRFVPVALPTFPAEINVPTDLAPPSIGSGQVLNLAHGGTLPANFVASPESQLNMAGGSIGTNFRSYGASVAIADGTIASTFEASLGSQVNITGGTLNGLRLTRQSQADISNATLYDVYVLDQSQAEIRNSTTQTVRVESGSRVLLKDNRSPAINAFTSGHVTIESGLITGRVTAGASASITVAGGIYTSVFDAEPGGSLRLVGDKFALNGLPVTGLANDGDTVQIDVGSGILTGLLADGSPIVAGGFDIAVGSLTLERRTLPDVSPGEIVLPGPTPPASIRSGQKLTVGAGASLGENFRSGDNAIVVIDGGSISRRYQAIDTHITLRSGSLGPNFQGYAGTRLEVEGGTVHQDATLSASYLEMTGGVLDRNFRLSKHSTAIIHRGQIREYFRVTSGSATIYGGTFGDGFSVGTVPVGPRGTEGEPEAIAFGTTSVAVADIFGGEFGGSFSVYADGHANIHGGHFAQGLFISGSVDIHGGTFAPRIGVASTGTLTLYGTEFSLGPPPGDGPEIDLTRLLAPGVPYLLEDRNRTLTATLADGSPFQLRYLATAPVPGPDYMQPGASLYLVLVPVPEPASVALALVSLALVAIVHCSMRALGRDKTRGTD